MSAAAAVRRHPWAAALGAAGLLIAVLHLAALGTAPPGLYSDEASIGYNAWAVAHTGIDEHGAHLPLYFEAFGEYKNPVYVYLLAPFTWFLPLTSTVERLPAALCSLGVVAAAGATAWRLTRSRPALLATVLTAGFMPWLTVEGRVGFEVPSMVLSLALALLCLAHVVEGGGVRWALGAGVALGVSVYGYSTGRLLVAVLAGLLLWVLLARRRTVEAVALMVPVVAAYVLLAAWSSAHPGALTGRFSALSITADSPSMLVTVERFVRNYVTYVGAPFLATHGDANPRHNTGFGGMLLIASLPAVLLGVAHCLRRLREPFSRVLLGGLAVAPVPAALTAEGTPHALRASAMVPFLLVLAGLGWAVLLPALLDRRVRLAAMVALAAAAAEVGAFEHDLFVDWPGRALGAFDTGETDAVRRAHDLAGGHRVLLSTSLDQPYIMALFVLRPDPHDYLRRGLDVVGMKVDAPESMASDSRTGDLLVLGVGDTPPQGAQQLFVEQVTVASPVVTVVGPDSNVVPLVAVFRR
ncbi:MAG TPA: glycosyltransferase family 39 protein [Candidatus Dormibacteraeota bacterium]|nr:glycosyltransferase family 39 protein [Candidatus Dormibacteraeota bacterium]